MITKRDEGVVPHGLQRGVVDGLLHAVEIGGLVALPLPGF